MKFCAYICSIFTLFTCQCCKLTNQQENRAELFLDDITASQLILEAFTSNFSLKWRGGRPITCFPFLRRFTGCISFPKTINQNACDADHMEPLQFQLPPGHKQTPYNNNPIIIYFSINFSWIKYIVMGTVNSAFCVLAAVVNSYKVKRSENLNLWS